LAVDEKKHHQKKLHYVPARFASPFVAHQIVKTNASIKRPGLGAACH
jgi:hypothetical protein